MKTPEGNGGGAAGIAVACVGLLVSMTGAINFPEYWYDHYNNYHEFSHEFTRVIDDLLFDQDHGVMGPHSITTYGKTPGQGSHYFYMVPANKRSRGSRYFITLIKKEREINGKKVYCYLACSSPAKWGSATLQFFQERLLAPTKDNIQTYSIDLSAMEPAVFVVNKICEQPKANQEEAIEHIMSAWQATGKKNIKVLISGERGVGKTYTAYTLKKHIDTVAPNTNTLVFDDFDPTAIGVNIRKLALTRASPLTPLILVINEIDISFKYANEDHQNFDPREQHAKNRSTMNNMMDAIGSVSNVIAIYTTEKSYDDLAKVEEYRSFLRPGRIDLYLNMTNEHTTQRKVK